MILAYSSSQTVFKSRRLLGSYELSSLDQLHEGWCMQKSRPTDFMLPVFHRIVQQTLNMLQHALSLAVVCVMFQHGERAYRPWWASALLAFFEAIIPAASRYFFGSPQAVLGSLTTFLIILFTPLSEVLWGAPGHGWFMVKFHFQLMSPTVLTGT